MIPRTVIAGHQKMTTIMILTITTVHNLHVVNVDVTIGVPTVVLVAAVAIITVTVTEIVAEEIYAMMILVFD